MRKALLLFLLLISACHPAADLSGDRPDVLLQEVGQDLDNQRFEAAMENGLRALEIARGSGDRLGEVKALQALVGIDIMASRDGDAWEKALEAETIAREKGFKKELSGILVSKAKLCSYAEISPETGRNDEGLAYAREALVLAEETEAIEQQCEACLIIGSLYINKNRWSDPIDPDIYRTAGEWLDRGQALCDSCDLPRLWRNGILFRSRWFQQGGRNEEAILHFEHALSSLKDSDHLTASALDDRLVRLYTRTGRRWTRMTTTSSTSRNTSSRSRTKPCRTWKPAMKCRRKNGRSSGTATRSGFSHWPCSWPWPSSSRVSPISARSTAATTNCGASTTPRRNSSNSSRRT